MILISLICLAFALIVAQKLSNKEKQNEEDEYYAFLIDEECNEAYNNDWK